MLTIFLLPVFFVDLLHLETIIRMCICTALHTDFSYHYKVVFPGRFPYILLLCSRVMSFIIMVLLQYDGAYFLENPGIALLNVMDS